MPAVGGDLATLQDLNRKFLDAANQTASLRSSVDSSLQSAVWTGPNSEAFRSQWEGFKQTLNKIENALNEGAADVKNQHNNIALATGAGDRI